MTTYYKLSEASERFGIPVVTLKDWIKRKQLPYKQFVKRKGSPRYIDANDIPDFKKKLDS